jgi:putative transcriptional regulator
MRFRRPGRPIVTAPDDNDVYAIRCSLRGGHGATQENFAQLIGVPVTTVRAWEQRRRRPSGAARVLLGMIAKYPWVAFDALNDQLPHIAE